MRILFMLVLFVGLGLAGGAVYMAQKYIGKNRAELAAAQAAVIPTVDVFVVKHNIAYGAKINKKDVVIVRYPANALPVGVFKDPNALFPPGEAQLRMAKTDIAKFEPLTEKKVTKPGEVPSVTSVLEEGQRAFTLKVNVTTGVSGFLRPGSIVDIYWTGKIGNRRITKLIKSAVKIIAVDQSINPDVTKAQVANTVTIAASPQEVAGLQQAQTAGQLSLSLQGEGSDEITNNVEVDLNQVLGIEQKVDVKAPEKKVCTIKSRKGVDIVTTEIPCGDDG